MSDQRRVDREGIHIERELADEIAIDEELDANVVGTFRFPSPQRRRLAGWVSVALALLSAATLPTGWLVGLGFLTIAAWQFLASWPLNLDEHEALRVAGGAVDFPVGHASASVRFRGWRSIPLWAVVLYSAAEPPDRRALVIVDAVNGRVLDSYAEDIAPL